MSILSFFRRRTKSRYADDQAVDDFVRVAEQQRVLPHRSSELMPENDRLDEIARLLTRDHITASDVDQLSNLLGQADPNADKF